MTMKYELARKGLPPRDRIRESARSRKAAERREGRSLTIVAARMLVSGRN